MAEKDCWEAMNMIDLVMPQVCLAHQAAYLPLAVVTHPSLGQSQKGPPLSRAVGQCRAPRPLGWTMARPRAQVSPLGPAAAPLLARRAAPRLAPALHQPLRRARLLPPAAQASRSAAPLPWRLALGAPQLRGLLALLRLPLARHSRLQVRTCSVLSTLQCSEVVLGRLAMARLCGLAQGGFDMSQAGPLGVCLS